MSDHVALLVFRDDDRSTMEALDLFSPDDVDMDGVEYIEAVQDEILEREGRLIELCGEEFAAGHDDATNFYAVPAQHRAKLESVFPELADRIRMVGPSELEKYPWDHIWERARRAGRSR